MVLSKWASPTHSGFTVPTPWIDWTINQNNGTKISANTQTEFKHVPVYLPELSICWPADSSSSSTSGFIWLSSGPPSNQVVECSDDNWPIVGRSPGPCPPVCHWQTDCRANRPIIRVRVESQPLWSRLTENCNPGSWPIREEWADGWPTRCAMAESLWSAVRQDDWSAGWPMRGLSGSRCWTGLAALAHCCRKNSRKI